MAPLPGLTIEPSSGGKDSKKSSKLKTSGSKMQLTNMAAIAASLLSGTINANTTSTNIAAADLTNGGSAVDEKE